MKRSARVAIDAPTDVGKGGRPRDSAIDSAVLKATAELVAAKGYADLSITAIAARAGTSAPAIYRRWPSKAHLVHEAVFPAQGQDGAVDQLPDSDDIYSDIRTMVTGSLVVFSRPEIRAAMPGLLAEMAIDPTLHQALLERFRGSVWDALHTRIQRAINDNTVRQDADSNLLVEAITGITLMSLLLEPEGRLDDAWIGRCTDLIMRGIALQPDATI